MRGIPVVALTLCVLALQADAEPKPCGLLSLLGGLLSGGAPGGMGGALRPAGGGLMGGAMGGMKPGRARGGLGGMG
ncbi:acanthoscurrin-2-like [Penaeus monodon]|uniref:acanthoscurrin-2-like n=1 Tax=Penaeus monodon TaxID=6687 RepID=UPI0018A70528|nr:acanthoscurrin-2-like [Penaeus monodon]